MRRWLKSDSGPIRRAKASIAEEVAARTSCLPAIDSLAAERPNRAHRCQFPCLTVYLGVRMLSPRTSYRFGDRLTIWALGRVELVRQPGRFADKQPAEKANVEYRCQDEGCEHRDQDDANHTSG